MSSSCHSPFVWLHARRVHKVRHRGPVCISMTTSLLQVLLCPSFHLIIFRGPHAFLMLLIGNVRSAVLAWLGLKALALAWPEGAPALSNLRPGQSRQSRLGSGLGPGFIYMYSQSYILLIFFFFGGESSLLARHNHYLHTFSYHTCILVDI